ncbi:unnamed protein product [Lymnaea stagnalis]|uniref:Uncharacterized protein n=1 Tax=Lymnaea stagnalis TaxID=6523 RepID=A0AAV2IRU3_LYMST
MMMMYFSKTISLSMLIRICFGMYRDEWNSVERPHSFTFVYTKAKDGLVSLTWKNYVPRTQFQCSIYNMPKCDAADENTSSVYEANMTSNSSAYISVFTIKSVQLFQDNTIWMSLADLSNNSNILTQYHLNVFAQAKTPTCDTVTLFDDINIQIHCLTESVYPAAICEFYINTNTTGLVKLTNGSILYKNQPSSTNGYIRTECTYTVSACILGHGSHFFSVVMYPNITSDLTDKIKTVGQYESQLILDLPDAPIIYSIKNGVKSTADGNMLSLYEGIASIICEYKRGFPPHKNISLKCGTIESYSSNKADIDMTSVILNTSTLNDYATCTCKVWRDDFNCPQKRVTIILNVELYQSNLDNGFKAATIGLGVTAGILVLVLLVAFTVFIVCRYKGKCVTKSRNAKKDNTRAYSDIEIEENPHTYEMPNCKATDSAQQDLTKVNMNKRKITDENHVHDEAVIENRNRENSVAENR